MPAATSAPNTSSSRISVIGTEVASALRKSLAEQRVDGPADAGVAGLRRSAGPDSGPGPWPPRGRAGATAWSSLLAFPGTLKVTRALRPSPATSPAWPRLSGEADVPARNAGRADSAVTTCRTAWRICGSRAEAAGPPGLDQHVLRRRGDHAEPLQGLLGLAGLAGVVGGHVLGGQAVPGHEDRGDQDAASRTRRSCGAGRSSPAIRSTTGARGGAAGLARGAVRFPAILN